VHVSAITTTGKEDLFVTYYGKNRLYHNLGSGKFEQVADKSGAAGDGKTWSTGCAFLDYDRDGRLDIAIATYVDFDVKTAPVAGQTANCMWKGAPVMCGPRGLKPSKNILLHNLGNEKFEDVSAKSKFTETQGHYCFSVSPLDYDDDGWPDIYVACDSTPSILYHNQHDGTFKDVALVTGTAYNEDGREQAGMGAAIGDFDNDGRLDIFRTNFSDDTSTLYRNNGDGSFTDRTFPAGIGLNTKYLGWGAAWIDYDNDGWRDLLLVNGHVYPEVDPYKLGSTYREPKVLYRNNGNGTLTDVSARSGSGVTGKTSARGLAVGDLWNDGRMSAVVSNMGAAPNLLVNQTKTTNHWIAFRTIGTRSNRDGIGARLTVKTGKRTYVDEVRSGSSYDSNNDMRPHFGLSGETVVEYVEVRWPSGLVERFNGPAIDKIHMLREGAGHALTKSD
jgi:enediyne biosynthesis protein E4